jgi:hypothetical protein
VKRRDLLRRLRNGDLSNIPFHDFLEVVEHFGFVVDRTRGSHHILRHGTIPGALSLQSRNGEAKPYQVRQFLQLVQRYNLRWDDDDDA